MNLNKQEVRLMETCFGANLPLLIEDTSSGRYVTIKRLTIYSDGSEYEEKNREAFMHIQGCLWTEKDMKERMAEIRGYTLHKEIENINGTYKQLSFFKPL